MVAGRRRTGAGRGRSDTWFCTRALLELAWRPGISSGQCSGQYVDDRAGAGVAGPSTRGSGAGFVLRLSNFALLLARRARKWWPWKVYRPWSNGPRPMPVATMCIMHGFSGRFIAAFGGRRMGRRGLFCGTLGSTARRCFRGGARHRTPQGQAAGLCVLQPGHAGARRPGSGRAGVPVNRAGILDMFPQTAHVEAMALFEAG